jgi:drug/metabolite transporter (DMT)-like permease
MSVVCCSRRWSRQLWATWPTSTGIGDTATVDMWGVLLALAAVIAFAGLVVFVRERARRRRGIPVDRPSWPGLVAAAVGLGAAALISIL